jgi:N-acetyltransferase
MATKKQMTLSFGKNRLSLKDEAVVPEKQVKPQKKSPKKEAANYVLDCGQKDLCTKTCPHCGMTYMYKLEEDTRAHEKFCKQKAYIEFKGWKTEKVVLCQDLIRIIEISSDEPKPHLKKLEEIHTMIDQELGSPEITGDFKTYVYISDKKIHGCLIAERIDTGYVCENNEITKEGRPALCGISRIWVHPAHRRTGIARKLIETCRYHFIYGFAVPIDQIAFSQPTNDGKAFASHINPQFLVYRHV